MSDPRNIEFLIERAKEADRRAEAASDPEEKLAWLRVAAFWLIFAERTLELADGDARKPSFQTMH